MSSSAKKCSAGSTRRARSNFVRSCWSAFASLPDAAGYGLATRIVFRGKGARLGLDCTSVGTGCRSRRGGFVKNFVGISATHGGKANANKSTKTEDELFHRF